jgi:hypothetical protein
MPEGHPSQSASVTVGPGEYLGMVNFGWDHQFQP